MSSSTETTILRALIEKENGFVSGSVLARSLGMSRVAVWQHMEKMRSHGFEFEAIRARGYRLTKRPDSIYPDLVRAHLASRKIQFGLDYHESTDSTNDEAARQLAAGREAPFVVVSKKQTRGRGRFGRVWHSEDNGNLYISFAFRPQLEPARMQTFTLWMGVNICELIANFTRTSPRLKWPNDILFDGRKAGGILTEARMDADQIRDLVFGLGINLNSPAHSWPDALQNRATSLSEQTRAPLDINKFTAALIGRVLDAYEQFVSGAYLKNFAERWHPLDVLKGQPIQLQHGQETISGTAAGIDDEGSLIIRTDQGRTERFRAGEVTIAKNDR